MNWFVVALVALQTGAGLWYAVNGSRVYGLLFVIYAVSNVILFAMERGWK